MTPEVKWACIRRLEARLVNEGTLDYPQAAHDALIMLRELRHFKADSEFLREEKARVWGKLTARDMPKMDALAWLLRKATMAMCEDGEHLCIWLNHTASAETEAALLVICTPSGDDGELIAEDAPFLTDEQRANLNGSALHATGYVDDKATIRKAVEYVASLHPEGR